MNEGYIKLHRKILDNPIINKDNDYFRLWIYLLLKATHQEISAMFGGKRITLKPGELITGTLSLSKNLGIEKMKIQRILKAFESDKQIEQQISNKGRLIKVVNWELYQSSDNQFDKQMINKRETTDKQLITNKNERINYYYYLEEIYARAISSPEIELLDYLLDNFDNRLVIEAIKNSAINNAKNLNYVKQTLINWKSEGKNTVDDLKKKEKEIEPVELFDFNWLEETED